MLEQLFTAPEHMVPALAFLSEEHDADYGCGP